MGFLAAPLPAAARTFTFTPPPDLLPWLFLVLLLVATRLSRSLAGRRFGLLLLGPLSRLVLFLLPRALLRFAGDARLGGLPTPERADIGEPIELLFSIGAAPLLTTFAMAACSEEDIRFSACAGMNPCVFSVQTSSLPACRVPCFPSVVNLAPHLMTSLSSRSSIEWHPWVLI